jgi:hypothetical protein
VTDTDQPEWAKKIQEAAAGLGEAMQHAGHILTAQGAMGWAYRGDIEAARKSLDDMPTDKLLELSAAASVLASLADEVADAREAS